MINNIEELINIIGIKIIAIISITGIICLTFIIIIKELV
jgi:hypothetical protein